MNNLARVGVFFALCCPMAQADTFTLLTTGGFITRGFPVDTAFYTTGPGLSGVRRNNLGRNATNFGQSLSDLEFTLSNAATAGAYFDATGNLSRGIAVSSNSVFPVGSNLVTTVAIEWSLSNTAVGITVDVSGAVGVGPKHDPIAPPSVWRFDVPSASAATSISSATLSFGGTNFVAGARAVPEPGFYGILALAVAGLLLVVRRRDRH